MLVAGLQWVPRLPPRPPSLSFSTSITQAGVGEGTTQSMKGGLKGFLVSDTGQLERDRMMGVVMKVDLERGGCGQRR